MHDASALCDGWKGSIEEAGRGGAYAAQSLQSDALGPLQALQALLQARHSESAGVV